MGFKKDITTPQGDVYAYHAVYQFEFNQNGGCVAEIGSYYDEIPALLKNKPLYSRLVRCDGVTPSDDAIRQIYCILASDAVYSGATAFSDEAAYGLANPKLATPEIPPQPSPYHTWDSQSQMWIVTDQGLTTAKADACQTISLARNLAERSGFTAYDKVFDSDDKSVQRITIAAQAAGFAKAAGQVFNIEWTLADNSTMMLDADQMIGLPLLMAEYANQLHVKARGLKDQINAATTLAEVDAVVW